MAEKESVELRQLRKVSAALEKQWDSAKTRAAAKKHEYNLAVQESNEIEKKIRKVQAAIRALQPPTTWLNQQLRQQAEAEKRIEAAEE